MFRDDYDPSYLDRRSFLRVLSGSAAALAAAQVLSGCGGGGTAPGTSSSVVEASGSVDIPGISANTTRVLSAYADGIVNVTNNQFKAKVSNRTAHIVLALDASNTARGMSISAQSGSVPHRVQIDAASTAAALIFLAPGIATSKPGDAQNRLQKIVNLPQFPALRDALAGSLAGAPLPSAVAVSAVQSAYSACLSSYLAANRSTIHRVNQIFSDNSDNYDSTLNFVVGDTSDAAHIPVTIKNADLRVLQVYRKDFPASGKAPVVRRLDDIDGAEGASLGGLITQRIGEASETDLTLDMSAAGSYRVEFYFRGMGKKNASPSIPQDVRNAFVGTDVVNSATIKTVLWNFIVPLISLAVGLVADPAEADEQQLWKQATELLLSDKDMVDALTDFFNEVDSAADSAFDREHIIKIVGALVNVLKAAFDVLDAADIVKQIITTLLKKAGYKGIELAAKAALADLALEAVGAVSAGLTGGQLIGFAMEVPDWHLYNRSVVKASGTGTVVIS